MVQSCRSHRTPSWGWGWATAVCCGLRSDGTPGAHLLSPGMDTVPQVLNFGGWIMMRLLQMLTHLAAGHSLSVTVNRIHCISECITALEVFDVSYDSLEKASLN